MGLAGNIPVWSTPNTEIHSTEATEYQPRYLSDSGRLFFNSADALVPQDVNGTVDVYEFEPVGVGDCTAATPGYISDDDGCIGLISSGTAPGESAFLDASESGDDVFFLTAGRLTGRDVDGALDVYDASVGGGEAEATKPPECDGDACQPPATPPNDATPGSLTFSGPGNVKECPKGKKLQKGRCVKQKKSKKKKHHHQKKGKKSHKRTGSDRGGHK
jgi:hypothetical protein